VGVGLGVATVILVIAVLDGVDYGLRNRFLANEAHLALRLIDNSFFGDYQNKIERIINVDGVVAASPVVYSQMGVFQSGSDGISDVIHIKGIDPVQEDKVTGFSKFVNGSIDFQTSPLIEAAQFREGETIIGGIVVGSRLAQRLRLNAGDVLRLVVRLVDLGGTGSLTVDFSNFVVIGFYESELAVYDSQIGFIDNETAQKLYNKVGKVNVIFVRLEDPDQVTAISPEIEDAAFSVIEMPITTTWLETHAPLFAALKMEKIATIIIEALIILVAAFNIASTLIMTVMEKTRDVGTLRTLGASRGNIMGIFMIKGSVIGMLGTIVGTTLGLYICWLLSTNVMRPSLWYAVEVIGIVSLCQVAIAYRRIHIVGVLLLIFVSIQGIGWLVPLKVLPAMSWQIPSVTLLLIRGIGLLTFWIFVMIKSWQKLSPKWKMTFFLFWSIVLGFVLFSIVEPISLKELGLSEIYQMNQLPIKVNWFFVCFINLLSFAICWLATIYPAWQASNLKPIEALQYE
jgi:lipoprotein-releasing system permease protein